MTFKGKPPANSPIVKSPLGKRPPSNMITRSGKVYSNPAVTTTTTTTTNPPPPVNPDPHKWSHPKSYNCFDFSNIQGGEHDLPIGAHSWLPFFSGKEIPGNSHWAHFCDGFDFHLDGQAHLDIFMKLFASSLTGEAKTWIDKLPEKSIKNVEELQRAFKARWCDKENLQDLFSQYEDICRGPCEDIREFTDRFNLALKKVRSKVGPEQAIIDRYLSSLEGTLHFRVKDRSPATLEEAQELAFEVERSLDFDEFIEERNMYSEPWDPDDEPIPEPENPSVLQVELAPAKRKWSLSRDNTSSQEPPPKKTHPEDEVRGTCEELDPNQVQDFSLFINQVGDPTPKKHDFRPFYVTLRVNGLLLHNCLLHPGAKANIMTEEVMQQLGLKVSQSNTKDNFVKGAIKDLEVVFDSYPDAPFQMNVFVIDDINKFGIIICDELIAHLGGSIHREQSEVVIPHPEGGHYIVRSKPFAGASVEDPDEVDDQLLCINSGLSDWFIQEGKLNMDTIEETEGIWTLEFDGSHSGLGAGAGVVLTAPSGEVFYRSYRLEFNCTNNVAEYEALILGLNLAIDKGATILEVKGDSDLIVSQVLMRFATKNEKLKKYRDMAQNISKTFRKMSLEAIPREENHVADALAVSASTLQPCEGPLHDQCKMEVLFRPSIPDNLEHWQVFEDDDQIIRFMENSKEFTNTQINFLAESMDLEVINLQNNTLPKGCIPLEDLFDRHDVFKGRRNNKQVEDALEFNVGTEMDPRTVKIGKGTTEKERKAILNLIREFRDIFAWNYDELKAYRGDVIQHAIPLIEGAKPFRQKLRHINPKLAGQIQKELQKMVDAGIIAPIRYSSWMSNLVVVRKKNGDIRLCVDFRNLNQMSLKDNYPLPNMEHLLQRVTGAGMMSMLDGFSGYNQVLLKREDQLKTAFTTPWGTFMYLRMPFGLMNAGATFQRAMDYAFRDLIQKIIEIYQDDLTVVSKERKDHLSHLRTVFERCREYGISLNPKKSVFGIDEGKLLGHVASSGGVSIDPERVQSIKDVRPPANKKALQSFLGKINFIRRFVPNFAERIKPLSALLKKDVAFRWGKDADKSFEDIKNAISQAPVLISPDFSRDFIIFSFASQDTIAGVLMQKDADNFEHPVAFMSKVLRDSELNYTITEKQAYALVKSLQHFRNYVGYNKIKAYVPYPAVKDVLSQQDCMGTRGKWVSKIQEYDLEIKPTKIIKGQGLAQMLTESNQEAIQIGESEQANSEQVNVITSELEHDEWYSDIVYYLKNLSCPDHLVDHKRRALRLKAMKYCLTEDGLGWKNPDGVILRCVNKDESKKILKELHSGYCGGHFAARTTAHKILRAGYYWPTLFSDAYQHVRSCQPCQFFTGKPKLPAQPLKPVVVEAPFQQWGLDFIGEFKDNSSNGYRWILTATDYFTRWVESIPTKKATEEVVMSFLEDRIITRFGIPSKITTDNAKAFSSYALVEFCFKYGITLSHSSNYYPQGNGLAESTNKNLMNILKKVVEENKKSWDSKLKYAVWADRITTKTSTGKTPFELVYGLEAKLPVNLQIPILRFVQQYDTDAEAIQGRINQLIELDETRRNALGQMIKNQEKVKNTFDHKARGRNFVEGDLVLLWDKRKEKPGMHKKFDSLWGGPYKIRSCAGVNSYNLETMEGEILKLPVNALHIKRYYPPDT
jgi:ribonuclease HI/transposase InsO family protein